MVWLPIGGCWVRLIAILASGVRQGYAERGMIRGCAVSLRAGRSWEASNMRSLPWSPGHALQSGLARQEVEASDYAIGADLSFLKQAEDRGTVFKDGGQPRPGLQIFKDHGYNWVRLRLFHTPTSLPNNLDYTIALAQQARRLGFKFLLDFHYSDTWADPGKQFTPAAWKSKTHDAARAGGVRIHARHDSRVSRGRRAARHGADRQRGHRRHALARRQAAGALGSFCRAGEGRHPGRRCRPRRRPAAADHDSHRPGRRPGRHQGASSTGCILWASTTT